MTHYSSYVGSIYRFILFIYAPTFILFRAFPIPIFNDTTIFCSARIYLSLRIGGERGALLSTIYIDQNFKSLWLNILKTRFNKKCYKNKKINLLAN